MIFEVTYKTSTCTYVAEVSTLGYDPEHEKAVVDKAIELGRIVGSLPDDAEFVSIKKVLRVNKDKDHICIKWKISDVIDRASERGLTITEHQAKGILNSIKRNHDASVGINWDVIDSQTDSYLY